MIIIGLGIALIAGSIVLLGHALDLRDNSADLSASVFRRGPGIGHHLHIDHRL